MTLANQLWYVSLIIIIEEEHKTMKIREKSQKLIHLRDIFSIEYICSMYNIILHQFF